MENTVLKKEEDLTKEQPPLENLARKEIVLPEIKTFSKRTINVKRFDASSMMSQYRDVYTGAKTQIASFIDSTTGLTVRPLTREEEFVLMPEILNIRPDAPEFNKAVDEFFVGIGADIEDEGLPLDVTIQEEINLKNKNGEVIGVMEYPVNILDYIIYRLIKKHIEKDFRVANSLKECIIGRHEFYIEDIKKDNEDKNKAYKARQTARVDFIALTAGDSKSERDKEKIKMIFDVTYNIHQKSSHSTELQDMIRILDEEVLQKDPDKMVELMNDEDLADKALINQLVTYNVISTQGNIYFNNNEPMGDLQETIKYLNNPIRADIKPKLRVKLQEKLRLIK